MIYLKCTYYLIMNILKKFNFGLKKTSSFLSNNFKNTLSSKKIDQEILNEIELILLSSDIGIKVSNQLVKKIQSSKISNPENFNLILNVISEEIESILKKREKSLIQNKDNKPIQFYFFIGVNGSGKTTTIGKLINKLSKIKKF